MKKHAKKESYPADNKDKILHNSLTFSKLEVNHLSNYD